MRVGIVALLHESNTFISERTTLADFERDLLAAGSDIRRRMAAAHHELGGFFEGLDSEKINAVGLLAARALPYGVIDAQTHAALWEETARQFERAAPLDGLLVALHGATVSEAVADVDGDWLARLRQLVRPHTPIIVTLDAHANLSPAMVAASDALLAYRTNPHLDQRRRGRDAARLMARALRGEVRLAQAAAFPPMAIDISRQRTDEPPCHDHFDRLPELSASPGVLDASILLSFPYADVPEMGSAVVVVTDGYPARAQELANELAGGLWRDRERFVGSYVGVDQAVEKAAGQEGSTLLLDMGDNVGGGSPGDGTLLAAALLARGVGPSLACLADPETVESLHGVTLGESIDLRIGGKCDRLHGEPIVGRFELVGSYDGRFEEDQPRHGGFTTMDQGRSAVVRSGVLTLLVTSRRVPPFSLRQLTSCGLDPTAFRCLVAKGVNAPLAAYAPICRYIVQVDTPGVTRADMRELEYRRRRRPMFPFEPDTQWTPEA